jgi:transaldolase
MLQTPRSTTNPLQTLHTYGQSVWLDYIRRSSITSGELQQMVTAGEIWGVTSNPAIFEKAIAGSTDYDDALQSLEAQQDQDAISLYEQLAIADIQANQIAARLKIRADQKDIAPSNAVDSEPKTMAED